jgi:hypothetical protein
VVVVEVMVVVEVEVVAAMTKMTMNLLLMRIKKMRGCS